MAWRIISTADVRLTPQEVATLNNIAGSTAVCADILANVVREFVGAIRAGYGDAAVADDGTIPDLLRLHVINRTRWLWLVEFPSMKVFQTPERSKLNDAAEKAIRELANRELNVEPATAVTASGNWNAENKLIMRTHPVPAPGTQFQSETGYANPDGPADTSET